MNRLDRVACLGLLFILFGLLCVLVFGEARHEEIATGRFHLPWTVIDMRQWDRDALRVVQGVGLLISLLVLVWPSEELRIETRKRLASVACGLLLVLVALGTTTIMAQHVMTRRAYFDYYDTYHYLLGARYFEELGYDQHYTCTLVALREVDPKASLPKRIRDLTNNEHMDVRRKFFKSDHAERCHDSFSKERLLSFGKEVKWFQSWFSRSHFQSAVTDHGYNGPPPLTAVQKMLSDGFELNKASIIYLSTFNIVVLYAAAMAIVWAFGWKLGLCFFVFFWMSPVDGFNTIPAFVRYLWLASLVASFAFLRRGKYAVAGTLVGISACMKLFPVVFFFPLGLRGLQNLWSERRLSSNYARFLGAGAATGLVFLVLGAVYTGGFGSWSGFFQQMDLNAGRFSSGRMGFVYQFVYPKDLFESLGSYHGRHDAFHEDLVGPMSLSDIRWIVSALLLALSAWASKKMSDTQATIFWGFCLHFCLFNVVRYYYPAFLGLALMLTNERGLFTRRRSRRMWTWIWGTSFLALWLSELMAEQFIFNTFYGTSFLVYILIIVAWMLGPELKDTFARLHRKPKAQE